MDYGIPLGLGLIGLAIIAFVLWEMFRRPKCEMDWAARKATDDEGALKQAAADWDSRMLKNNPTNAEVSRAFKLGEPVRWSWSHVRPGEPASAIIDLPKTLDDVCGEVRDGKWQSLTKLHAEHNKRMREMG